MFAGLLYSGIYDKKSLQQHLNILQKSKLDSEITFHPGTGLESEKNYFKKIISNTFHPKTEKTSIYY